MPYRVVSGSVSTTLRVTTDVREWIVGEGSTLPVQYAGWCERCGQGGPPAGRSSTPWECRIRRGTHVPCTTLHSVSCEAIEREGIRERTNEAVDKHVKNQHAEYIRHCEVVVDCEN